MPFVKGQSGNPGGRVGVPKDVRDLARSFTEQAVQTLVGVMGSDETPAAARVAAATAILDRGWGKPTQPLDGDGEGGPIKVQAIEWRVVRPTD